MRINEGKKTTSKNKKVYEEEPFKEWTKDLLLLCFNHNCLNVSHHPQHYVLNQSSIFYVIPRSILASTVGVLERNRDFSYCTLNGSVLVPRTYLSRISCRRPPRCVWATPGRHELEPFLFRNVSRTEQVPLYLDLDVFWPFICLKCNVVTHGFHPEKTMSWLLTQRVSFSFLFCFLQSIIFIRDYNTLGQEVSGYIDYAHRLKTQDFEPYFSRRKRLMPERSDLW